MDVCNWCCCTMHNLFNLTFSYGSDLIFKFFWIICFFFNFFLGNRRLIQRIISIELWTVLEKYIQCVHINSVSVVTALLYTDSHTQTQGPTPLKGSKWHGLFVCIITYYVVYVCIRFGGGLRCFCFIQINMATAHSGNGYGKCIQRSYGYPLSIRIGTVAKYT